MRVVQLIGQLTISDQTVFVGNNDGEVTAIDF